MYCSAFSVIIHSITKLQKAMGHSSINVSLTYLRGLEIAELKGRRYAYGLVVMKSMGYLIQNNKHINKFNEPNTTTPE